VSELTGVPALTLLNPWAHLIAHGGKNIENRTWSPPRSVNRLLIHAGKGWDDGWETSVARERVGDLDDLDGIAASAIVAVVDLVRVCNLSRDADDLRCVCNEWAMPGQLHWWLGNVRPLPFPVPCRGARRLWLPEPGTVISVEKQLAVVSGV